MITLSGTVAGRPVSARILVRRLDGQVFYHQCARRYPLVSCADPASADARYPRAGGGGVWYGSSRERGAWAELLRYLTSDELSPFEIRRRVGRVRVRDARVLVLTDEGTRRQLGVEVTQLVADDYRACQDLAEMAAAAGLDGVLAPAAALPGHETIAIFASVLQRVVVAEHSRVQVPPVSLLDALHHIRPVPEAAGAVRALFHRLLTAGKSAIRRGDW